MCRDDCCGSSREKSKKVFVRPPKQAVVYTVEKSEFFEANFYPGRIFSRTFNSIKYFNSLETLYSFSFPSPSNN